MTNPAEKPAEKPADKTDAADAAGETGPSHAQVARALGGKITVLETDKKTGETAPVARAVRAGDVLAVRMDGKTAIAVLIDGSRREAEIA